MISRLLESTKTMKRLMHGHKEGRKPKKKGNHLNILAKCSNKKTSRFWGPENDIRLQTYPSSSKALISLEAKNAI